MQCKDVVIVGSGHAGAQAALALRQRRFAGSILMIGEEADPPYERPPLSKDYLSGDKPFDRLLLRPAASWAEREVDLLPGRRVLAVDPARRQVTDDTGDVHAYGTLIWAAGGHARRLACPGHELAGIHTIRTRADVDRLRAELPAVKWVVVVGGGYIGLEAAAVLVQSGRQVTLLEAQDRVLARVAGEALSRHYEKKHRAHGVRLRLGVALEAVLGAERVQAVQLADGSEIPADLVIVGIGIIPAVGPLLAAGAAGDGGVDVDHLCRTSLDGVYAIGDCARQASAFADGARVRIESVQNAMDQAGTVARHLTGGDIVAPGVPTFWSNQYDLRLQTAGLSVGHDRAIIRGDPDSGSFSVIYLRDSRVIAVDGVNCARDFIQGKSLVASAVMIDPLRAADASVALNDLRS